MKNVIIISILLCFIVSCKKQVASDQGTSMSGENNLAVTDTMQYIDTQLAERIKPVLSDWLKYYDLDINAFQKSLELPMDIEKQKHDTTYTYYNYAEFTKERDVYTPQFYDYSPDKNLYLNILEATFVYLADDGKYHYSGSDDSQGIVLFNRKDKSAVLVTYRGYSDSADAAFWVDNDMFVIAGYATLNDQGEFTLEIYNLKQGTKVRYVLPKEDSMENSYLMFDMKKRNVIID